MKIIDEEVVWMIITTPDGCDWQLPSEVLTKCEQLISLGWTGHDLRLCLKASFAFMTDALADVLIDAARASLDMPSEDGV